MNANFDKQRFVKCLKHRLTDRFMIAYSILALVCCLPMIAVFFATGVTSFPLLMSCLYISLFSGMFLAIVLFILVVLFLISTTPEKNKKIILQN